jgi:predicted AlkP superfamily pyrophosphatase or phosphodiesterase
MAYPSAVIDVVGLSSSLLGGSAPNIAAFANAGRARRLVPVLPAVTCPVQASMLTGLMPSEHGIVGNGWYDRTLSEVHFWQQSNKLVCGEKVWEEARRRDPSVTCANLFWWFNMYSSADLSVTPRPIYKADGRKIPDVYTEPQELRELLQQRLGRFPLFEFWGPGAGIRASRWIGDAARIVWERHRPTLTLVYLPHLDYGLQRLGPDHPQIGAEVRAIDDVVGELLEFFARNNVRVMILSEYGIESVDGPVHVNRSLRAQGALRVRLEQGLELLDPGASDAFAVADHQVAHVYVKRPQEVPRIASLCRSIEGVGQVLEGQGKRDAGLDHERCGDLVLVASPRRWFTYYYWLDDDRAPDFARTVDIHRKPGYDPAELFLDPRMKFPRTRVAWKLFKRSLGARALLDVIPLDATLVRGSHGRVELPEAQQPLLVTGPDGPGLDLPEQVPCTSVREAILESLFTP